MIKYNKYFRNALIFKINLLIATYSEISCTSKYLFGYGCFRFYLSTVFMQEIKQLWYWFDLNLFKNNKHSYVGSFSRKLTN